MHILCLSKTENHPTSCCGEPWRRQCGVKPTDFRVVESRRFNQFLLQFSYITSQPPPRCTLIESCSTFPRNGSSPLRCDRVSSKIWHGVSVGLIIDSALVSSGYGSLCRCVSLYLHPSYIFDSGLA